MQELDALLEDVKDVTEVVPFEDKDFWEDHKNSLIPLQYMLISEHPERRAIGACKLGELAEKMAFYNGRKSIEVYIVEEEAAVRWCVFPHGPRIEPELLEWEISFYKHLQDQL